MSIRSVLFRSALLGAAVAACSARAPSGSLPAPDREILTQADLVEHGFANALEAIQALRPIWLQTRGPNTLLGTPTEVVVYLNDTKLGGVSTLDQVTTPAIVTIRHLNGREATARWGLDHGAGAIVISTFH